MGLLDSFLGNADQTQALGLLGANMMAGNTAQGFAQMQGLLADAPRRRMEQKLLEARIAETMAQADERRVKGEREQAALAQAERQRAALPGLFRQPGMTGGAPQPQMEGNTPMFSRPMSAAPMRATPGGFDVQGAIAAGFDPKQIEAYAALQNIGRQKATRQMEVDDGKGGKRIALVDDFGREVAGFAGYTAPVQVDTGKGTSFVTPRPGLDVAKVPTFADDTARRGQDLSHSVGMGNLGVARQRLAIDTANGAAGKAPAGYRFTANGQLEFIPGGPADPSRNGEKVPSEGERKAATLLQRLNGSQAQLGAVLQGSPGAAKPEIIPSMIGKIAGSTPANLATSGPRQQVEAAQLDMLDAALTLGTGAAYTKEQLEGYRKSYFPQIGDDAGTVSDKQARLKNVIEAAKIAAGRAGGAAGGKAPAPMPGMVKDGYRFKGGNPGDPASWEKQ